MKNLPNVRLFLSLLLNPGWAPILVVVAYFALAGTGLATQYDAVFHGLGGASIAYFVYMSMAKLPRPSLELRGGAHFALAFGLACTAAVFWEFAEYGANRFMGVMLQVTLEDTIGDLFAGVVGGAAALILIALIRPGKQAAD